MSYNYRIRATGFGLVKAKLLILDTNVPDEDQNKLKNLALISCEDLDDRVLANAIEVLSILNSLKPDEQIFNAISKLLSHNNNRVVGNSILAIYIDSPENQNAIDKVRELGESSNIQNRLTAIYCIGKMLKAHYDPDLVKLLLFAFSDSERYVRSAGLKRVRLLLENENVSFLETSEITNKKSA